MTYFGLHHFCHLVRHRPHTFADLRMARQSRFKTNVDVPILIGGNPWFTLRIVFPHKGACFHTGMDFIPCPVKKARIDEENPFRYGADAFLEVDRRPTFLIHYTHFDRVARQAKSIFHRSEQIVGERGFFRTMHFWFHDIKTSRAAI